MRQWKRGTNGYTRAELRQRFHQFDVGGDGKLNHSEFKHLLESFGISLRGLERETLMDRFDRDNDGSMDMHEFFAFIESEKALLHLDPQLDAKHPQHSKSSSSVRKGKHNTKGDLLSYSQHRSPQMRSSSSTPLLASKGNRINCYHGRGEDDQNQVKRQTRGPSPPPYYRSTVDCAPAPPPYDFQASEMDLGIGRKPRRGQTRREERDEDLDIVIDDYDDSGWALRCNSRHRNSERKNVADTAYAVAEEESEEDSQRKDDCSWAVKMLHAQEQLEKRLGSGYY